jgi:Na+-driven multidrug efflux pump
MGGLMFFIGESLCSIMTDTEEVLKYCRVRITTMSILYITLGMLQVVLESIRAIGYSFTAMLLSLIANVVLRITYILFLYPILCVQGDTAQNLTMLYLVYPLSWSVCAIIGGVLLVILYKKVKKRFNEEKI